jgi:hypothetical protein
VKSISEICATPTSPALPTLTIGTGLVGLKKLLPTAEMADHASPTIRDPAGTKIVLVTKYVP